MIKLGVARKYAKDLERYIAKIAGEGVDAFEVGFAYGVPEIFPEEYLKCAEDHQVTLSGHLPFWINLGNLENREKNVNYLSGGFRLAEQMKSTVVFHLGFYGKNDYESIHQNILKSFDAVLQKMPLENGRIGIETTGKQKAIGTVEEIVRIVNDLTHPNVIPVVDWSHLYARSNGMVGKDLESFLFVIRQIQNNGGAKPDYFHGGSVLFQNGNEQKHISARNLAPSMPLLQKALEKTNISDYTLIIESPDSINDIKWLRGEQHVPV